MPLILYLFASRILNFAEVLPGLAVGHRGLRQEVGGESSLAYTNSQMKNMTVRGKDHFGQISKCFSVFPSGKGEAKVPSTRVRKILMPLRKQASIVLWAR